jgi:hypothetical protein
MAAAQQETRLDEALRARLERQLAFYFSEANLRRDAFLRAQTHAATGRVAVAVVAAFPKVRRPRR